ncbi:MAG: SCO family protein [Nitratireductor sp.]
MRPAPLIAGALALVALIGAAALVWTLHAPDGRPAAESGATTSRAVEDGPQVGGPFSLETTDGARMTQADFEGKPYAVFFGFTHCPDVCPTTMNEMAAWIDALGPAADRMRFAFVTVDPERDDIETLSYYTQAFSERIIPLSGTQAEIDAVVEAFKIYAQKVELEGGDYTMNHTAAVYLMDSNGRFVDIISFKDGEEVALRKLRALIDGAPTS